MSQWQPIETAPKDGTQVLLGDKGMNVHVGWWGAHDAADDGWWFMDRDAMPDHLNHWLPGYGPTHWMPLPDPPGVADE